jgi:hypothetical protein
MVLDGWKIPHIREVVKPLHAELLDELIRSHERGPTGERPINL